MYVLKETFDKNTQVEICNNAFICALSRETYFINITISSLIDYLFINEQYLGQTFHCFSVC